MLGDNLICSAAGFLGIDLLIEITIPVSQEQEQQILFQLKLNSLL